ncbi:aquaporin Z [Arthrobacter sp. V1I7]|uniref:MIP/aquaporin family protein n=1 Tax=Arthrobacter sp. V1I7 TaxID=3042274 RepID=UPI0027810DF9|nr:aquaporin Z [Arthrobacter sp. V1I7]
MTTPAPVPDPMSPAAPPRQAAAARPARPAAAADAFRPALLARLSAEALGTLVVVVAGLGVPLFTIPDSNPLSASLAAGLALTAAMLAFGYLSGGHFNPAVTVGNAIAGRIRLPDAGAYLGAQLVGALLGVVTLFAILRTVPKISDTRAAFDTVAAGFGEHSIIQAPMAGALLVEVLSAALLVAVYLGATSDRNPSRAAAPFAVGLTMAVLLQLGQAIGNTPFNPARATASALFSNADAAGQLWLFWVAPLVGAVLAGLVFRGFTQGSPVPAAVAENEDELDADDELGAGDELGADDELGAGDDEASASAAPARPARSGQARAEQARTPGDEARDFFDGNRGR